MKKLRRLTLSKEVINKLNESEMDHLQGKGNFCTINWVNCNCPNTSIGECPYFSAYGGDGCSETCGWAPTCNGR